jgi:hypothetical protein
MIQQYQATSVSGSVAPVQVFRERVSRLSGVVAVETRDNAGAEPSIVVYLQPDDEVTERRVYELESEIYNAFPGVCLEVLVLRRYEADPQATEVAA